MGILRDFTGRGRAHCPEESVGAAATALLRRRQDLLDPHVGRAWRKARAAGLTERSSAAVCDVVCHRLVERLRLDVARDGVGLADVVADVFEDVLNEELERARRLQSWESALQSERPDRTA